MSRLLVPVHLDVLLVRQAGGRFADAGMAAPTSEDQRHRDLWKPPFSERPAGRARGAYLHWALPDALTHGSITPEGAARFQAIPDRWLVVRLSPSAQAGRRAVRGWVLEADRGVARPLDGWTESGQPPPGRQPLTALGHGDLAWAAYFDNVENRLAFHDDLADVAAGPIAYLVCGWHAQAARDPLADPTLDTRAGLRARLAEMAWGFSGPAAKAPDAQQPRGTLYHGSAVRLSWPAADPASREPGGPPPAGAVRVVLAGTTCEALATLLARNDAEVRLLEAAQLGVLDELAEPDGRARLDAVLHASGFGSVPGGEVIEQVEQPQTAPEPPGPRPFPGRDAALDLAAAAASMTTTMATATAAAPPAPVSTVRPSFAAVVAPEMATRAFVLPDRVREAEVQPERLQAALDALSFSEPPPPPPPAGLVDVHRALPRFFHPADPVILIQGARRSFRHGGDGRFTQEGVLACRGPAETVGALSVLDPRSTAGARLAVRGESLLDRALGNAAVPAECEGLLRELALLDPGAGDAIARAAIPRGATAAQGVALRRRVEVEQTVWWAARDARVSAGDLLAPSGLAGTLPSPVAVTPPRAPWTPVHLEWSAAYVPSAAGARAWQLGEIDYSPEGAADGAEADAAPVTLQGRTLLTPAAADIAAGAARRTLREARGVGTAAALEPGTIARFASDVSAALDAHAGILTAAGDDGGLDLPGALAAMDVLSGTLDPLHAELRGGVAFDEPEPAPAPRDPSFPFRAGTLRLLRLRLVDGFGQFVDLLPEAGTDAPPPAASSSALVIGETMRIDGAPDRAALPPRLTAPARMWLRYSDGAGTAALADARLSPVAGYLLPNHLDEALEIFDVEGQSRGALRSSVDGGLVFEAAPGIPTTLGRSPPDALGNAALAGIVQGLLDWGIADAGAADERPEGVLAALLRLIDAARWSVDPQGHGVDDDLGPLVGRPVAVLLARAWLEVDARDLARLQSVELPLRLGAVANIQDGLYGAFVGGDYRTLHASGAVAALAREVGPGRGYLQQAPLVAGFHQRFADDVAGAGPQGEGASPVVHPYVARDRPVAISPGREIALTLLCEPYGLVHATTGVLPRKEIGMRREWLARGLARMAPTFRFGPVLVDPRQVRLPVSRETGGTWSWAHRLDETTWSEEAVADAASQTAAVGTTVTASEGWLRFAPPDPQGEDPQ